MRKQRSEPSSSLTPFMSKLAANMKSGALLSIRRSHCS